MTKPIKSNEFCKAIESIERRERRSVTMPAFIATEDGVNRDAVVLDLSYDGCGIKTALPLTAGQAVTLRVPNRGVIGARVRWWTEGRGGLVFQDCAANDAQPEKREHQSRAEQRIPLVVQASLRRLGMGNYRINVSDLSPKGCKVDVVERPRVGEHVLLKFDQMDVIDAEVCWVREHHAGLRFERPIHDAVFTILMRRLASGQ